MEKFYDCDDVAEIYKVKKATVWGWIRRGFLSAKRVGKLYRISAKDLKDFDKKNQVKH